MQETPEGAFKAETIPPGTYAVNFTLGRPQPNNEMISAQQTITISGDEPGAVLDLGEIQLEKTMLSALH